MQSDGRRAAGAGCLVPHPAGTGNAARQAPVSVRCLPEGVRPLPFCPPQTASPCAAQPCPAGAAGILEPLPKGAKGPAQHGPVSWGWARPRGRRLGWNPAVLVNACSLRTGIPSQRSPGWASLQAGCSHCPPSAGAGGVEGLGVHARQRARRVFEARMDAWLMSHVCWARKGRRNGERLRRAFPLLAPSAKGPSPPQVPLCPLPVSPLHLLPRISAQVPLELPGPTGAAGYGERQGCGHRARAAWRRILPARTLARCLPALCSMGRGEADTGTEATEPPGQGLVSRYHPGEPWPWLSSPC